MLQLLAQELTDGGRITVLKPSGRALPASVRIRLAGHGVTPPAEAGPGCPCVWGSFRSAGRSGVMAHWPHERDHLSRAV